MSIIENILSPEVTEILSRETSWRPIDNGIMRKGCRCQNFQLDDKFIIKLFRFPDESPPSTYWWDQEHQALLLLDGKFNSPMTHGYVESKHDGFTTIYLFREMVTGETLERLNYSTLNKEQCIEVGELLANFHNLGLVTGDCHLGNLLLNNTKRLSFIDFGNAQVYPNKSLTYGLRAARDLKKAQFKCINLDPELSQLMEKAYLSTLKNKLPNFLYEIMRYLVNLHQELKVSRRLKKLAKKTKLKYKKN